MPRAPRIAPWIKPLGWVVLIPPRREITGEIGHQREAVADYRVWFAVWAPRPVIKPLTAAVVWIHRRVTSMTVAYGGLQPAHTKGSFVYRGPGRLLWRPGLRSLRAGFVPGLCVRLAFHASSAATS